MTTITNYLNSNFIGKEINQYQRPFLVLESQSDKNSDKVWEYVLKKNMQNKSLIVLDFGIRTSKIKGAETSLVDNKLKIKTISKDLKQYIISIQPQARPHAETYHAIPKAIQDVIKNNNLNSSLLLIEGLLSLQIFISQNHIRKLLSSLNNINKQVNQINVLIPSTISLNIKEHIEKMGSCILKVSARDTILQCQMIVRRYTGYSSREYYILELGDNLKARKKEKSQQVAPQQLEHDNIGFSLLKSEAAKQQQKELRKIIYPYLNVQDKCENCSCVSGECKGHQEQFLVLDQEQEAEDDVDV